MLRLNDYACDGCRRTFEALAEQNEPVSCPDCGESTRRLFPVFRVNVGPVTGCGYYDDNLQAFISTNAQRKELMRQQGVTEKGATPKEGPAWV